MSRWLNTILFVLLGTPLCLAQSTLKVRHDHDPWGACEGELIISDTGVEYRTEKEKHSRTWPWQDIQSVDRKSEARFTILTYADQSLLLGRDQPYDFDVLPESPPLDDRTFDLISDKLPKPVVDRLPDQPKEVEYEVPVKHLHTFGGCEGTLKFGPDLIVFETSHEKDARTWRKDLEVSGIWSVHDFDLQIQVHEKDTGDVYNTRNFRFQLKEPLDSEYYEKLRRELLPVR